MNILFVCTGNTCRSPMAEALMRELAAAHGKSWVINSAGIYAAEGIEPSIGAQDAMAANGIDLSAHRSMQLTKAHLENTDMALGMTSAHLAAIKSLFPEAKADTILHAAYGYNEDIPDPFGGDFEEYMKIAGMIQKAIEEIVKKMIE